MDISKEFLNDMLAEERRREAVAFGKWLFKIIGSDKIRIDVADKIFDGHQIISTNRLYDKFNELKHSQTF